MVPKKILFIVQLPPPTHGCSLMNKLVVESRLINSTYESDLIPLYYAKSLSDMGSLSLLKILKLIGYFFRIVVKLTVKRPDLIYFNLTPTGNTLYRDLVLIILFKIFNIKTIYHLHRKGFINDNQKGTFKKWIYKFVFNRASIICLSNSLSKELTGFANDVHIVNNGIRVTRLSNKLEKSVQSPVRILFLSNLWKFKGIYEFLGALKVLNARNVNFHAHVVGDSGDVTYNEIATFIKEHELDNKVFLLGPKYGDEKIVELNKADIFVFPSKDEAFPLVLLEAMQYELPIVSSYEGAIPEIVENERTGFLVDVNNNEELVEKIQLLISSPELRIAMGKAGYVHFMKNFTYPVFEERLSAVFQKVLN